MYYNQGSGYRGNDYMSSSNYDDRYYNNNNNNNRYYQQQQQRYGYNNNHNMSMMSYNDDPYNRLYNDPYTSNPSYYQYGNTTYNNNQSRYRTTRSSPYYNQSSPSSTTTNNNQQQQQSHTSKQDLKRIKYLFLILTSCGSIFYVIWRKYLSQIIYRFIRNNSFFYPSTTHQLDEEEEDQSTNTTNHLMKEYNQFLLKRKKMNKTSDGLKEKEIDDLLDLINEQYETHIGIEQEEEKQKSRSILIIKLLNGINIHKQKQKDAISYLRRIDKMDQNTLKQEFKRIYDQSSSTTTSDQIKYKQQYTINSDYSKLISNYLKQKQVNNNDNNDSRSIEEEQFVDQQSSSSNQNIVQEYIEKEERFVKRCEELLNLLYSDMNSQQEQEQQQPTIESIEKK